MMAEAAEIQTTEPFGEAQALADILGWSKTRPAWQQDALRRLCEKDTLSSDDLNELAAVCKDKRGKGAPLAAGHIKDPETSSATVNLRAIHGVQEVNALAEGQRLSFDKSGMTVIYGDNGSGKSGYARVLKKVCRARMPGDEAILRNIYGLGKGPQRAVIDFSASKQNQSETWEAGETTTPLLSAVSVFDAGTANIHVDETNDVAYMPFPMKLLEQLAQGCQDIKKRLNAQIAELEKLTPEAIKTPNCHDHTRVGALLSGLSAKTKADEVKALAALSKNEKARLDTLRADLAVDPVRTAPALLASKGRLDGHIEALRALSANTSDEKAKALCKLFKAHLAAKAAAHIAAHDLFTNDPLPEIGSESWRALWESARAYSDESAYPGQEFPVTGDDTRCVLCQQTLGLEAAKRLNRFEDFIRDETIKRADEANSVYEEALDGIEGARLGLEERRAIVALIRDELNDEELARAAKRYIAASTWRLRNLTRNHQEEQPELTAMPASPEMNMVAASEGLALRAAALLEGQDSEECGELVREREELEDRQWLAGIKADVNAEIGRKETIGKLKQALKDTSTTAITTKSSELSEKLVTHTLRAQFSKEIDKLGVAGLAIELVKERSSYGVPLFRVSLTNKPDTPVGDVLSEGEHRCVALAAFLAELATSESGSAIVFDDPVSSLDHMHREALASRLADEAQQRQIIVFTHDIAFLFLLNEFCREKGTHIGFRSINKGADLAGYCQDEAPANAQPVDHVIASMQKQLDNQKTQHEQGDKQAWYRTVRSLQEQLRTTWERAVEDALAPVCKRLSHKINTPGLSKLTAVTLDDCKTMREAYGRCSNLLHSQAEALNTPLPAPDKIQAEITALKDWAEDLKMRQEKIDPV